MCRFIVTISCSSSSLFGTLPVTELKSWRLTPLKTILFPLRSISPSFTSNFRKPILCSSSSVTLPVSSFTSSSSVYRFGFSALQSSGASSSRDNSALPFSTVPVAVLPHISARIAPLPLHAAVTVTVPLLKSLLISGTTERSVTAVFGSISRYTLRKMPEKR